MTPASGEILDALEAAKFLTPLNPYSVWKYTPPSGFASAGPDSRVLGQAEIRGLNIWYHITVSEDPDGVVVETKFDELTHVGQAERTARVDGENAVLLFVLGWIREHLT